MAEQQQITVGRVVHAYLDNDGAVDGPFAALTAGVYAEDATRADLVVMHPERGAMPMRAVPFSDEPQAGHWTWQPVQRTQRPDVGAPLPRMIAQLPQMIAQQRERLAGAAAAQLPHEQIARVAHEVNRAYQLAIGEPNPSPAWDEAPPDQRASAIAGIATALAGATPEQQHEAWASHKLADGWRFGPVKDPAAKTHPCLVPYAALPVEQRVKDNLYGAVVRALATLAPA
jgi:hypothetical protein